MSGLHNLKPDRVVKAFQRAGWRIERKTGSHVILSHEGCRAILTVPVHRGKPLKQGLLRHLIRTAGLEVEEFVELYK